jgi:hypothetical protein
MLGPSFKLVTSIICLNWALKWQNALDICVVKMIFILCCNILVHTMKLLGVVIVRSFLYLDSAS